MATLRSRYRQIEMAIIYPTTPVVRPVVLAGSAAAIGFIIVAGALELAAPRALIVCALGLLSLYGRLVSVNIRPGVEYARGFKAKESLQAWAWALLAALTLGTEALARFLVGLGLAELLAWVPWLWLGVMIAAELGLMDFVIRANNDPDRIVIKTSMGLAAVPDQRTRERIVEQVAGWLRHGMISTPQRELLEEGLGHPALDKWGEALREQLRQRREAAARADQIAALVEIEAELRGS
jgi:hypothetical protein